MYPYTDKSWARIILSIHKRYIKIILIIFLLFLYVVVLVNFCFRFSASITSLVKVASTPLSNALISIGSDLFFEIFLLDFVYALLKETNKKKINEINKRKKILLT